MERMGLLDAEFWDLESDAVALHIGGIALLEGPAPNQREIVDRFRSRLDHLPRMRQKMRGVRFGVARPRWFDDPGFDLSYHLRRVALPQPGSQQQLETLIGRIMSYRLDDHRPLWEAWVIEGLAEDRWALLFKVHHSMVDGLGGMALFTGLLDQRGFRGVAPPAHRPRRRLDGPRVLAHSVAAVTMQPRHTLELALGVARGGARYIAALRPFAATSLTGTLGAARRYRMCTVEGADFDLVRSALGGTRNDVALTLATRGFRELLRHRGEDIAPDAVRCLVPVAVSGTDGDGNRVSAMLVELPVDYRDVGTTHGAMVTRMREHKQAHEAEAGEYMLEFAQHLPPMLVSAAVHAALHVPHRVLTTVVTNVPGPRQEQQLLGRRMTAVYPYVPIADRIRIGIAVSYYVDKVCIGITSDHASVDDIDVFVTAVDDAMQELAKIAQANEELNP